jgi:hypothetical protein
MSLVVQKRPKGNECDMAGMVSKPTKKARKPDSLYSDNKIPRYGMLVILGTLVYLLCPDGWTLEERRGEEEQGDVGNS